MAEAAVISAVIITSGALQIIANLCMVTPSLRRFGAHGHTAGTNAASALILAALAVLIESRHDDDAEPPGAPFVSGICTLYVASYLCSASGLTALNQMASVHARRFGAPVGTATGIGRSVFSVAFGIAPAASIAMYRVVPWLPLALLAAAAALTSLFFVSMLVLRWADPMPPAAKRALRTTAPPAHDGTAEAAPVSL